MNFGEVIQNWKSENYWIDDVPNPFVNREISNIVMNPAIYGEVFATFVICDMTYIVGGKTIEFLKSMEFHTACLNGTKEEKDREAIRLQQELENFTNAAIAERQQQIDDLRAAGVTVLTTNPYEW